MCAFVDFKLFLEKWGHASAPPAYHIVVRYIVANNIRDKGYCAFSTYNERSKKKKNAKTI